MSYVIGSACIDVRDRSCLDECPVDCIYEGSRKLYIHPDECIDCGACEPICPVEAISADRDLPGHQRQFLADSAAFFTEVLPGRSDALGSPGGASGIGPVNADSPLVAAMSA